MHLGRRAVLGGLLGLLAAPAMAQGLGFGLGMQDVVVRAGGGAAPLDGFTQPAAAYSLRKLRSGYSGPAIKLRRTTGGTQDVGFLGFVPGLGSPIDVAAANTFCASTTCFVDTWYDQSGLGQHMTQATAGLQLAFIFNCIGGQPCARTTTATQTISYSGISLADGGTVTLNSVSRHTVRAAPGGFPSCKWFLVGGNAITPHADYDILYVTNNGVVNLNPPWTAFAFHSTTGVFGPAGAVARVDAAEVTGTASAAAAATLGVSASDAATCDVTENVAWLNYALTPAERAAWHVNQKSFWGF